MSNANALYLGVIIFSFLISAILIVPFINLLYKLRFQRLEQKTIDPLGKPTPIFDRFNQQKAGTPVGGGIIVICLTAVFFFLIITLLKVVGIELTANYGGMIKDEIFILFFTWFSFGMLGLYDDIKKFFHIEKSKFFGLKMKHKLAIQVILAFVIGAMLYYKLHIDFINIPFFGLWHLGGWFIPLAALVIVAFTNAVNITDGMDGLAGGILMISLIGFWLIAMSIIDTPMSIFISVWIGGLIAFLYFNVYPARIFMGDVGALAFGATFALIGLMTGKVMALVVIGFVFVIEVGSSLIQLLSKKFRKKKAFSVSPFHLYLRNLGWEEPKIVQRMWLAQIVLTVFGLWLTLI